MSTLQSLKERLISHFTRYTLSVRCAHSVYTLLQGESRDAILHISHMIELSVSFSWSQTSLPILTSDFTSPFSLLLTVTPADGRNAPDQQPAWHQQPCSPRSRSLKSSRLACSPENWAKFLEYGLKAEGATSGQLKKPNLSSCLFSPLGCLAIFCTAGKHISRSFPFFFVFLVFSYSEMKTNTSEQGGVC